MPRFTHKIRAIFGLPVLFVACSTSATPTPSPSISPLPVTIYAPTAAAMPSATATVSVTVTTPPTAVPAMPVVDVAQTSIHNDLLFIQDDRLMRWKSASNEVEVLLGDSAVWDYVLTADQKHAAVVLHRQDKDVLGMYHLESKTLDVLVPVSRVWPTQWVPWDRHWFKPSPDGRWVAYFQSEDHGATGKLMIHPAVVGESSQSIEAGFCGRSNVNPELSPDCRDFIWTPDSKALLWADGMGAWLAAIGKPSQQLRTAELAMPSATRDGSVRRFLEWSPNQQFLLVEIGFYEGSSQAVFDVATGNFSTVPQTNVYIRVSGQSMWLNNNSAMSLSHSGSISMGLALRQYNVVTTAKSVNLLPSYEVTDSVVITPANIEGFALIDANQINGIISSETDIESRWDRYLYRLNVSPDSVKPAIALPNELAGYLYLNTIWSPDAQVALIFDEHDVGLYLVSAVDEAAVKITTMLKGNEPPHRFEWLR